MLKPYEIENTFTILYIYLLKKKKNLHISESTQFRPMWYKDQLYRSSLFKTMRSKCYYLYSSESATKATSMLQLIHLMLTIILDR